MNKNLQSNLVYNFLYQILSFIIPLITTPFISRVIGPEKLGIYSYTFTIANYFSLFIMLGLKNYGVREIAKVKSNQEELERTFLSIYVMQLIIGLIICFSYLLFLILFVHQNRFIYFIQGLVVVSGLFDITWFFFGIGKFKVTVIRNTLVRIGSLVLIFLFVRESNGLLIYTLINSGGTLISQMSTWVYIRKLINPRRIEFSLVKSHIKPNLILFIPVLAISIYNMFDKIMLGSMSVMSEVGYYQNAEKIISIPVGFIAAFGTVMLSYTSSIAHENDNKKIINTINKSMEANIFFSVAIGFGIIIIAPVFVPLFLGSEFIQSVSMVQLMAPVIIIKAWANIIRNQYLIPHGLDNIYIKSVLGGAILDITLNFFLIPKYGGIGAVSSTVFTELIVCILQTVPIRSKLPVKKYLLMIIRYSIIGFGMFLINNFISNQELSTLFYLITTVITCGLYYISLCIITAPKKSILGDIRNKVIRTIFDIKSNGRH